MPKPASYEDVVAALAVQLDLVVTGFAQQDPEGPTGCEGWTVADLENHLAGNVRSLGLVEERAVDGPADASVEQWAARLAGFAAGVAARAFDGRLKITDQVGTVLAQLKAYPEDTVVQQVTGRHTLRDAAVFRLFETVLHGLDAGIEPARPALKIVVKELAGILAERHPGKSVEVRVPPYTAVQCLTGPRHTRGTPPNVVETDARTFALVCTGRLAWATAVTDGRIRASGERSDLSDLLPLLR